ncbi:RING-H2 finger protein ATL1-like [Lolium rigidum]|uniref:RING-H2 finger protein ATL1-like n=1 Tax=Lolium rigidum TaxID=89674 RepID=UPI001F5DC713|nr:RING-H2 finger protein ATL1-like [Lolium rigidum]
MDAAGTDPVLPMPSALLFPPPLAPYRYYSPPSTSSPASSALAASRHHASLEITSLPLLVLTVLGILSISALLLTYYVLVIRCCLTWHTTSSPDSGSRLIISLSRRRRRHSNTHELPVVHGPAPDEAHHGLAEMAIRALPAFRYSKAMKDDDSTGSDTSECAVCLGEFQEEERIKLLPSCLHVFHAECIDTWLQGNANCPLCRAAITSTTQVPAADLQLHRQRPEEVIIQVQVASTDEEADRPEGDAAYLQAGKENTKADAHFHGDGSDSGSSEVICRL